MKMYNDLTDYEKSNLTNEEFERYLNIARMQSDIKIDDPDPPIGELTDGMEMVTVWEVRTDHWSTIARFATQAEAEAMIALKPLKVDSDYPLGVEYLASADPMKLSANAVRVATCDSYKKHKPDAEARKALSANRASFEKQRADLIESLEEELEPMRDDRRRCRQQAFMVSRVRAKLAEFIGLCDGDETIARKFLAKHYSEEDIAIADSWPNEKAPC